MDLELTPAQQSLQAAARRVAVELRAGAQARERAHAIPHAVIRSLAQHGLLGVNLPKALGGSEAGVVAYALAVREIASADASVAVTMCVTNMVGEVIQRFGSPAQHTEHIPKLTRGDYFGGAFALSEPQAGSDAGSLTTKASQNGPNWSISGEKMWITTGDQAGVVVVWARTGAAGPKGISCFLVAGNAPGLVAGKPELKMGLRASHTVGLSLADVQVSDTARLSELGQGFRIAMTALDGGRIGIGAQACGIASRALELAVEHVRQSPSLRDAQGAQFKLADMATELDAAWLLVLRAAALKEAGKPFTLEAAMAKVTASETANKVCREAIDLLGDDGDSEAARLLRDCRVTQIYEGTSEVQRIVIGRAVTQQ